MAPVTSAAEHLLRLTKRRSCYYNSYGNYVCNNSAFSNWGRWVVVGVIIAIFLLFVCCACLTSRRRRSRGNAPYRGTGWMSTGPLAPPPYQAPPQYEQQSTNNNNYNPNQGAYAPPQQPKPAYGNQHQYPETHNQGFGQNNYEMAGNNGYAPPAGPPPTHYK